MLSREAITSLHETADHFSDVYPSVSIDKNMINNGFINVTTHVDVVARADFEVAYFRIQ
jgi:hypothetical protein